MLIGRWASLTVGAAVAAVLVFLAVWATPPAAGATGAGWRREVRALVRQIEQAGQALTGAGHTGAATPTPPAAAARAPRPARIPSLLLGAPTPVSGSAGVNVAALTDGQVTQRSGAWRTREGQTTADLRYTVSPGLAERVVFVHNEAFPPETWAKEVEVWLSTGPDAAGEVRAGGWTLAQSPGEQSFPLPPVQLHTVRLRVLSNYGSREYTSLAEFALLGG